MEKSTRFISLSGLSGVVAGVAGLVGAFMAQEHYRALLSMGARMYGPAHPRVGADDTFCEHVGFLIADGAVVLMVALAAALWFTWRRSRRTGQGIWDGSARRLLVNLFLPLAVGGLFALALLASGAVHMVPAATLVFYGLALLNASKYTLDEIRWLGLSEAVLGVVAAFWPGAGLLFWALGFGVLHLFYGGLMYLRHERGTTTQGA